MHILIKKKKIYYNNYRIKCAIGKRGIGIKKKEGDLITPIGQFKIKYILYRNDRIKRLNTHFKQFVITKKMGWCNDPRSKKYNKIIKLPFNYNFEKLYRKDNIYDVILVLNYNINPIRKNKGSAIFIHVAKNNYKSTEGCVAIKKIELLKILKDVNKNTKIKII
jgi:L,D-peptidoglycan transpeptidase YkuD (ErfK/YbiS/YcfS/YnhG family)